MKKKEMFLKIINILRYPLEFLFTTISMIFLYQMITIKAYEGYWSRDILIGLIITGIIALAILVYNIIKDKNKIEKMFINCIIPIGIMYIVFMLPTYTPDASSHLWKAYEVSNGIFITKVDEEGKALTTVPKVMAEYGHATLDKYYVMNEAYNLQESNDYSITSEVDSSAKGYSFILYIGYAIGFVIAKMLSLNIFLGMLIARLTNFIIVIAIGYFAIKKIPFGKVLLATYFMIPMMMQQATAFSADSLINAIIGFFIAYTLHLSFKKENLTKKDKVTFLAMSLLMGITKVTYIPIVGLGILLAKRRKEITVKEKTILAIATILLCLGSYMILNILNSNYTSVASAAKYLEEAGVNSSEQIHGIISNPLRYIYVLINDFLHQGELYLYNCIGNNMGWLTIGMPIIFIVFYIILLLASAFVEDNQEELDWKEKLWFIFLAVLMYVLIVTGLYTQWTGVGQTIVAGIQGRYFLPIIILPLLCLIKKHNYIKLKHYNVIIPVCALLINSLFVIQVIRFFI